MLPNLACGPQTVLLEQFAKSIAGRVETSRCEASATQRGWRRMERPTAAATTANARGAAAARPPRLTILYRRHLASDNPL